MPDLGLGERLRTRLRALGYWKNDRPDVARFALERGYRPQYIYAWLRDRIPDYENLIRLARDLNVTPDWLRSGAETDEQVAAAVGAPAPKTRTTRGAAASEPVARGAVEPEAPRTGRVIEHPMLRVSELTEKLSQAEAELQAAVRAWRENEERFRRVFDEGPLGMSMADPEYQIIKVNHRYCEMLGYTEKELRGMSFLDLIHPDDRARTLELNGLYRGELPYLQFEKRLLKKSGEICWTRATVFGANDVQGAPPYSLVMTEDITAQRLMEEELKRLVQQQELILQSVADGIYGTDERGLACFVNPAAVRLLGWEASDLIGQHFHDFVHRQKPDGTPFPKEECPIVAAWGRLTKVRGSDQWCRKDGTMLAVEYLRAPIIRAGKVVGSVITFREQTGAVPEPPAKDRRGPVTRKPRPRKGR